MEYREALRQIEALIALGADKVAALACIEEKTGIPYNTLRIVLENAS